MFSWKKVPSFDPMVEDWMECWLHTPSGADLSWQKAVYTSGDPLISF